MKLSACVAPVPAPETGALEGAGGTCAMRQRGGAGPGTVGAGHPGIGTGCPQLWRAGVAPSAVRRHWCASRKERWGQY